MRVDQLHLLPTNAQNPWPVAPPGSAPRRDQGTPRVSACMLHSSKYRDRLTQDPSLESGPHILPSHSPTGPSLSAPCRIRMRLGGTAHRRADVSVGSLAGPSADALHHGHQCLSWSASCSGFDSWRLPRDSWRPPVSGPGLEPAGSGSRRGAAGTSLSGEGRIQQEGRRRTAARAAEVGFALLLLLLLPLPPSLQRAQTISTPLLPYRHREKQGRSTSCYRLYMYVCTIQHHVMCIIATFSCLPLALLLLPLSPSSQRPQTISSPFPSVPAPGEARL